MGFFVESEVDLLHKANVEALASTEGNNFIGPLWTKYWVDCYYDYQITIESSGAGFIAGMIFPYDLQLALMLNQNSVTYTVSPAGEGEKSYCYDGWWFCDPDNCR